MLDDLRERIRKDEPIPAPVAAVLRAATVVQRAGMAWRLRQTPVKVAARVISFGNITAGGTGKTPAVIERAEKDVGEGRRVAVITRGYGSASVPEPFVVRPDDTIPDLYEKAGDEAALIRMRVPEVTIVKSADRVAGARVAIAAGCDTLILDDGFQAVALARDENIAVVDALNPIGNGHLVPRGILREAPEALARATSVILTHCDDVEAADRAETAIRRYVPNVAIRRTIHQPAGFWRVCDGAEVTPDELRNQRVTALCAIAHHEQFFETVSRFVPLADTRAFPDHASIPAEALPGDGVVIVTEKDAVRLSHPPGNVVALRIDLAQTDETLNVPLRRRT